MDLRQNPNEVAVSQRVSDACRTNPRVVNPNSTAAPRLHANQAAVARGGLSRHPTECIWRGRTDRASRQTVAIVCIRRHPGLPQMLVSSAVRALRIDAA